ncbi:glycosyltransferase family 9 protein [Zavarzinia sp. CC-PAN008]|uniref:glycosyltransferase family 9 protein n=1 Tax=Zavarzinia sp. CC-PAN008 TaxID=3243332 RepID=UPI003F747777
MRILFVTSNRVGDAILSTGLLDCLIAASPSPRVTVAAGPAAIPLFQAVPGLERLIALRKQRGGRHWLHLWSAVAFRLWDVVVDLRASALAWLVPARRRIVWRKEAAPQHRVVALGRLLGLEPPPAPRLWTTPAHTVAAARLVPEPGVLALGPTANWGGKIWPAECFAELVRHVTGPGAPLAGRRVAVFGGPGEEAIAAPLLAALGDQAIDLVGRVDLLTAHACLARAALFVGNDSGLMHLSAAAGTPTVGLFGPSKETLYGPWGARCLAVRGPRTFDQIVGQPGYDYRRTESHLADLAVAPVEAAARRLLEAA